MEGSQNLREVLGKASGPISLHTCISEEVQKQLADTPFVEKEEAREVGLCRGVHLGLQHSNRNQTQSPDRKSKRAAIWGCSIQVGGTINQSIIYRMRKDNQSYFTKQRKGPKNSIILSDGSTGKKSISCTHALYALRQP